MNKISYDPSTTYTAEELHKLSVKDLMILFCQAKKFTGKSLFRSRVNSKIIKDINLMRHILKG